MDWLFPVPEAGLVAAGAQLAARLGLDVPQRGLPALNAVILAQEGTSVCGALQVHASTTRTMNRDLEELVFTQHTVDVALESGRVVLDTLRATPVGPLPVAVMDVVRAWDVERTARVLRWEHHPTLPPSWAVPPNLLDPSIQWATNIIATSYAVVPNSNVAMLVGVSSANRYPPVASVLGAWPSLVPPGFPPLPVTHRGARIPTLEDAALLLGGGPAVVELDVTCPPGSTPDVGLWHVHLSGRGGLATRLLRHRLPQFLLRAVFRQDGGGASWVIQPHDGLGWAAHASFGRNGSNVDVHAVATHPEGLDFLARLMALH